MTFNDVTVIYLDHRGEIYADIDGELFLLGPTENVTDDGIDLSQAEVLLTLYPDDYGCCEEDPYGEES